MERVLRSLSWLPNALSGFRGFPVALLIGVVFMSEFFTRISTTAFRPEMLGDYKLVAFFLVLVAGITDWLDGWLAKKFKKYGWQTESGAKLDALCDKLLDIAALLLAVPFHNGLGWYLALYCPALAVVAVYSYKTTQMRSRGKIAGANKIARGKTGVLMVTAGVAFGNIAFLGDNVYVLWMCTLAVCAAAVMCLYSMERYQVSAPAQTVAAK